MSARYLRCVIREQIDRAKSLKAEIPARQRHAALEHLAAACRDMLETQVRLLERAGALLDGGGMDGAAAKAMRILKMCTRAIAAVEGYGLPPLHCQSEQAVFLSDVLSAVQRRRPAVSMPRGVVHVGRLLFCASGRQHRACPALGGGIPAAHA